MVAGAPGAHGTHGAYGAEAMLLTPAHQFPLGVTLHPQRRREAADWPGVVIEDDYDGEFRYDRQPVGALQALAPDHIIYAGTTSKSIHPARPSLSKYFSASSAAMQPNPAEVTAWR